MEPQFEERERKKKEIDEHLKKYIMKMGKLLEIATKRHPHSGDLARWGQYHYRGLSAYRICNICEQDIVGSSFDRHYRRTQKSIEAENAHMAKHLEELGGQ